MQDILKNIFKAYDVRGKVGTELTPELVKQIGKTLANWLPVQGTIAIGRDMRPDSAELARAFTEGLTSQGRNVMDIGEVTSDMIYFAVGHYNLAGGVVVTASHNPGEYNGIKFCREEAKPIGVDSGLMEIRDLAGTKTYEDVVNVGKIEEKDASEDWITHVLSFVESDKLKPLKIAVDAGNGMAGKIFPELEPYVPWEVDEMYFELDGTFPNHEANPLKFETLADMIKVIQEKGLDAGVAFDGDGDRAFLVDETGTVLTGGVMSAMLSDYFLKKYPGAPIVYDIRNSRAVVEIVEAAGGKPIVSRVGHSLIKQKMREVDAPFGGEASGHFYFRDNWYADSGLIAAVIGLYVAGLTGKKLSEIRKLYTTFAVTPEANFEVEDKEGAIRRIGEAFSDGEKDTLDGLTITFPDKSWLNVRPSNTEPVLRLNTEAKTQARLDELVAKVTQIIKS